MVGNNTYSKVIVNMYSLVDILVNRAFTNHKPSRPVFRTFYVVFSSDRTQPQMESSIHCSTSINSEDNSRTRLASPREATSSASVPPLGDRRPKKKPRHIPSTPWRRRGRRHNSQGHRRKKTPAMVPTVVVRSVDRQVAGFLRFVRKWCHSLKPLRSAAPLPSSRCQLGGRKRGERERERKRGRL